MSNPKIVFTEEDRELHLFDFVAVVWNLKGERKVEIVDDHIVHTIIKQRTSNPPYIDFVELTYMGEEVYEREDSPIEGGISLNLAKRLQKALGEAIEYLEGLHY